MHKRAPSNTSSMLRLALSKPHHFNPPETRALSQMASRNQNRRSRKSKKAKSRSIQEPETLPRTHLPHEEGNKKRVKGTQRKRWFRTTEAQVRLVPTKSINPMETKTQKRRPISDPGQRETEPESPRTARDEHHLRRNSRPNTWRLAWEARKGKRLHSPGRKWEFDTECHGFLRAIRACLAMVERFALCSEAGARR